MITQLELQLQQLDMKIVLMNGIIDEDIYMSFQKVS
jgi:hypothetical protein